MKNIFFALAFAVLATPVVAVANVDEAQLEESKVAVLALINAQRATLGLTALEREENLEKEIQDHAEDMAMARVEFGHLGFKERCDRVRAIVGRTYYCGEIVAWGQKTPERVHLAWTNSPGHYARMTDVRYTHAGFGLYYNEQGRPYWGVLFMRKTK